MPLVPKHIENLVSYHPGPDADEIRKAFGVDRVAELASNENALGSSPLALKAMQQYLGQSHRYSSGGWDLRRALAERFGCRPDNVIVGAGSEAILLYLLRAFLCEKDEVLTTEAAFVGFQILARSCNAKYRTVPYRNWGCDLPALAAAIGERTKLIYLANPNNPTGTFFTAREFEAFHRQVPERVLIIMDEAYFEYAVAEPGYPDSLRYRFDNVISLRTFSKIYGLAGLRVGYGFAHHEIAIHALKLKLSFDPNALGQAAAIAALDDDGFVRRSVEHNRRQRQFLCESLRAMALEVAPSGANFLMVALGDEGRAAALTQSLLESGVVIRGLKGCGLPGCVRITVGTEEENRMCVAAIRACLQAANGLGPGKDS